MKIKLLFLLFTIAITHIRAQTTVNIEDTNFEQALIDLGWDTNGLNGNLLVSDAVKIDSLKIWNPTDIKDPLININNPYLSNVKGKIKDISAIQFMPKLTYLYAGYNDIDEIDVSNNPFLTYLDVRVNKLTEIDVSKNTYLVGLNVAFNNLKNLDVTNNYYLRGLAIYSNSIRDIDVRRNHQLLQLSVGINPMPHINLENNSNLQDLDVSYTLIKDMDLSKNPLLKRLRCIQTNLDVLDLEVNPLLTNLIFSNNAKISELNLFKQQNLDTLIVSSNEKLAAINLKNGGNTKISEFKSLLNPKLTCINVDDVVYSTTNWIFKDETTTFDTNCYNNSPPTANNLSFNSSSNDIWDFLAASYQYSDDDGDRQKGTILKWFLSDDNQGTNKRELTSYKNKNRIVLNTTYNKKFISIEVTPSDGINIGDKIESSYYGPIETYARENKDKFLTFKVPDDNFEQALIDLGYDTKLDNLVLKENVKDIKSLNLDDKNISSLAGISEFKNLETLNCSNNNLSKLYLKSNSNLRFLIVDNNSIEDLILPYYASKLETINISKNKIKVLDLSKLKDLKHFTAVDGFLQALKMDNGNNANFTFFNIKNNTSLHCVQVDDVDYSTINWTNIDNNSVFSELCSSTPPTVSNLEITGELLQYKELTATYEYSDEDGYSEYGTKIDWYISDDEFGRNITRVNFSYNSFTQVFYYYQIGKYISFKITPGNGFTYGTPVESSFFGPIQSNANINNKPPVVTNLDIYGQLYAGKVISALYDYSDIDDDSENESLYSWYLSDDEIGTNKKRIEEANGRQYILTSGNVDKYLSFEIIPNDGQDYGKTVTSNYRGPIKITNNPPTVSNLNISGVLEIDNILTATYDYTDIENNEETGSIYQWYISNDAAGNNKKEIAGATDLTFTLSKSQEGKFISFNVTPYDGIGLGESLESQLQGPVKGDNIPPIVSNIVISGKLEIGNILTATYDYTDIENDEEIGSIYQWYKSDDTAGSNKVEISGANDITYTLSEHEEGKFISLKVTPFDGISLGESSESELQGPISNSSIILIPDANFEQALIDLGFDTNGLNGNILKSDAEAITILNISSPETNNNLPNVNSKIADLTGIESFKNLKSLIFVLNNIKSLDLSNNSQLTVLNCEKNDLVSLNVANGNNTNFTSFKTQENPNLSCIKVDNKQYSLNNWFFLDEKTGFSEDCSKGDATSNYYTTVPDEHFEKLLIHYNLDDVIDGKFITKMAIYQTELNTDIHTNGEDLRPVNLKGIEAFKSLVKLQSVSYRLEKVDLSHNVKLEELTLRGKIKSLDLRKLINLKKLFISDGELISVNLKGAINLEHLYLPGNKLENIDVTTNTKLTYISLVRNKLKKLDVTNNILLEKLGFYENQIEYIDVSNSKNLIELYAHKNNLEYLNMKTGNNKNMSLFSAFDNPNLSCIQVDDAEWSTTVMTKDVDASASFSEDCNSVWEVYTEDTSLNTALNAVVGLDNNGDGKITYEEAQAFTGDIDVSNQSINDVTGLEAFSNASSINISGNNITDISNLFDTKVTLVSKETGKKRTVLRNNLSRIKILNASDNLIVEIDISNVTTLTELNLSNNKLSYLNINNNYNEILESLVITGNPNLNCILVDDIIVAEAKTKWVKDSSANYNTFCKRTSLTINQFLKENIHLFPNPAIDKINILMYNDLQLKSVELYNLVGKKIKSSKKLEIDVKDLISGIYFVKVSTDKGSINQKIIKR